MGRVPVRSVLLTAAALAALCCAACGQGKKYYPVRGRLLVNGQPGEGVSIVLFPVDDSDPKPVQPSAIVRADGSFEIKTYVVHERTLKEGAPAGRYQVSCVWYPPDLQKYVNAMAPLPDRLHGKYSDAKASGLTAEVLEQPTELPPFELAAPK